MNPDKVTDVDAQLKANRIEIHDYHQIFETLKAMNGKKIGYDENSCNQRLYELMHDIAGVEPVHFEGVVEHLKAMKNTTEMGGMRSANIKNCVSLVEYFAWLENELVNNKNQELTEYTVAKKLDEFRQK